MRHPLLVEERPHRARQSLASTLSAPRVAATSCCDPGRHANVIAPCMLTPCLNVPNVDSFRTDKNSLKSGKKKERKRQIQTCGSKDLPLGWGSSGLPCEGVGAKKLGMSLEAQSNQFFGGYPGSFAGRSWRCPKCLRKKVCVQCFYNKSFWAGYSWLIRDPDVGHPWPRPWDVLDKNLMQGTLLLL